jgi:hypothetical protein
MQDVRIASLVTHYLNLQPPKYKGVLPTQLWHFISKYVVWERLLCLTSFWSTSYYKDQALDTHLIES